MSVKILEVNQDNNGRRLDNYLISVFKNIPKSKIDIPNKGLVINIAGTKPINVLINAVPTNAVMISLIRIGAINKFVKFLLQISSKKSIL